MINFILLKIIGKLKDLNQDRNDIGGNSIAIRVVGTTNRAVIEFIDFLQELYNFFPKRLEY